MSNTTIIVLAGLFVNMVFNSLWYYMNDLREKSLTKDQNTNELNDTSDINQYLINSSFEGVNDFELLLISIIFILLILIYFVVKFRKTINLFKLIKFFFKHLFDLYLPILLIFLSLYGLYFSGN